MRRGEGAGTACLSVNVIKPLAGGPIRSGRATVTFLCGGSREIKRAHACSTETREATPALSSVQEDGPGRRRPGAGGRRFRPAPHACVPGDPSRPCSSRALCRLRVGNLKKACRVKGRWPATSRASPKHPFLGPKSLGNKHAEPTCKRGLGAGQRLTSRCLRKEAGFFSDVFVCEVLFCSFSPECRTEPQRKSEDDKLRG